MSKRLDLDVDAIVRMYREGQTIEEIGYALGVHKCTIRERLKEQRVRMRPTGNRPTFDQNERLEKGVKITIKDKEEKDGIQEEEPKSEPGQREETAVHRCGCAVGVHEGRPVCGNRGTQSDGDSCQCDPGGEREQEERVRTGLQGPVVRAVHTKSGKVQRFRIFIKE